MTTHAALTTHPRLTIIVPVYNAMPYLDELIDSLRDQDLPTDSFEVLFVDDGSTDESSEVLDRACEVTPNFRVIHQENSGWAGGPRNVGLDNSESEYVFFVDSDDVLAPSALRRMVDYADDHHSDVVIPELGGLGGRNVANPVMSDSHPKIPLASAFRTLGPIKLYRRSLLDEHGIRFPEEKVRLEDGIFNAHAYTHARKVSQVSGEPLYFARHRDDGQNISVRPLDPEGYTWSIGEMCRIVDEAGLPESVRNAVILGLYRRKALKIYRPERFRKYKDAKRAAWLTAHKKLIDRYIPEELEEQLPFPYNIRSSLVRHGDVEKLLTMDTAGLQRLSPQLIRGHWMLAGLRIELQVAGSIDPDRPVLAVRNRKNGKGPSAPLTRIRSRGTDAHLRLGGTLGWRTLRQLPSGTYDLHLGYRWSDARASERIALPQSAHLPEARFDVDLYRTAHGNGSLKKTEHNTPPVLTKLKNTLPSWLRRRLGALRRR